MKIQNEVAKTVKSDDQAQQEDSGGTIIIF